MEARLSILTLLVFSATDVADEPALRTRAHPDKFIARHATPHGTAAIGTIGDLLQLCFAPVALFLSGTAGLGLDRLSAVREFR